MSQLCPFFMEVEYMLNQKELFERAVFIWQQKKVAEELGVERETVNRWLKGKLDLKLKKPQIRALESMLPTKNNDSKADFRFIDLFAGIGGLRKAFESIGGRCVFTSEWDEYAQRTYMANYWDDERPWGDITEITQPQGLERDEADQHIEAMVPDHDVLLAGFPCQPFSIAGVSKKNALGRKHGFDCDTQGTLFFDVARIIEIKQPKFFLLENVKNLRSHDKGKTFQVIMKTLNNLGYTVAEQLYDSASDSYYVPDHTIINAKNYVPQHRERIVLVGFRNDLSFDATFSLKEIKKPRKKPKIGDILESYVDEKYILTPKLWSYLQAYKEKHRSKGNGFGFGLVGNNDIARTLSARYYKDGSEILIDRGAEKRPRRLTPRECSRLMGFDTPNGSKFIIPVSDTRAYKQFGNSVVVPVFKAVADLLRPFIMTAQKDTANCKRKAA